VARIAGEVPTREQARSNMMEGGRCFCSVRRCQRRSLSEERQWRQRQAWAWAWAWAEAGAEGGRRKAEGGGRNAGPVPGEAMQLMPRSRRKEASESGE
jgi:hypothetical protein